MKKFLHKILLSAKETVQNLSQRKLPLRVQIELPYYSQWESEELADDIINTRISAKDDPKWKNSGAKDLREYLNWSWSSCGMACIKMILKDALNIEKPIVELGKECLQYGGYKIVEPDYSKEKYHTAIEGVVFKPLVQYLTENYKLKAKVATHMTLHDIFAVLSKKQYVIVSVNAAIRDPKVENHHKGGHLVVITGYDISNQIIYMNNPSGFHKKSQINAPVHFKDFRRFFGNRGITIEK